MKSKNEKLFEWIMLFIMGIISIFLFRYRFKHPEMTETELMINFFEAFKN